jgi:hypothetical protein
MRSLFEKKPQLQLGLPDYFNYKDPSHLEILQTKINTFTQALEDLQTIDNQIAKGLVLGSACWVGIYLFPLVSLSIVGFCYATHNAAQRNVVLDKYVKALNDLCDVYDWAMIKDNKWNYLRENDIQLLIKTLSPWVSVNSIKRWNDVDRQPRLLGNDALPQAFQKQLDDVEAGKHLQSWRYSLYSKEGVDNMHNFSIANLGSQLLQQLAPTFRQLFKM